MCAQHVLELGAASPLRTQKLGEGNCSIAGRFGKKRGKQNSDLRNSYPSGHVHIDFSAGRAAFISITAFFIFFAADLVDLPNVLWMLLQPIVR
jgi:hypothetical protein